MPLDGIIKLAALGRPAIADWRLAADFCEAVAKVHCGAGASTRKDCHDAGLIELVLQSMRLHPSSCSVQASALEACNGFTAGHEAGAIEFVERGGLTAVADASTRFPDDHDVAIHASSVIINVAGTGNHGLQAKVLSSGAVERVCAVMEAHPSNAAIQRKGCIVFRCLLSSTDGKLALRVSRAVECVHAARRKHRADGAVVSAADDVLKALGYME